MSSYKYNILDDVNSLYQNDKVKARFYCESGDVCKNLTYDSKYESYSPNTLSIDGSKISDAVDVLKKAHTIILSSDNDKYLTDIITYITTLKSTKEYLKFFGGRIETDKFGRSVVQIMIPDETPLSHKKYVAAVVWAALVKNENKDKDIINSIIDAA